MDSGIVSWVMNGLVKTSLQAGALAAVVWVVCRVAKKAPASFRCALWAIVLVKLFVPPMADLPAQLAFWSHKQEVAPVVTVAAPYEPAPILGAEKDLPSATDNAAVVLPRRSVEPAPAPRFEMPSAVEITAMIWIVGACALLVRLLVRTRRQRVLLAGEPVADEALMDLLEKAAYSLKIDRMPRLWMTDAVCTPTLVGFFRPTIVLPPKVVESCGPAETQAMLLHELAHIKRRDMAVLWLYEISRALFFFHPAVWLAGKQIEMEREIACDELVVRAASISAAEYAAGYVTALRLARRSSAARFSLGMAEPFEVGKRRVEMILRADMPRFSFGWVLALAIVVVVGLPTFAGVAENAALPNSDKRWSIAELRAGVINGHARTLSQITTGKGDVLSTWQYATGKRITNCTVAFSAEKFMKVCRVDTGDVYAIGFDGKSFSETHDSWTEVLKKDANTGRRKIERARKVFDVVNQSYGIDAMDRGSLGTVFGDKGLRPTEQRIIRHETVDGSDCLLLELVFTHPRASFGNLITTRHIWIDPNRHFIIPRLIQWYQRGAAGKKVISAQWNVHFRQYNDLWVPESLSRDEYLTDSRAGKTTLTKTEYVKYSPGFALNAPVTDAELALPKLAKAASATPTQPAAAIVAASTKPGVTIGPYAEVKRWAKPVLATAQLTANKGISWIDGIRIGQTPTQITNRISIHELPLTIASDTFTFSTNSNDGLSTNSYTGNVIIVIKQEGKPKMKITAIKAELDEVSQKLTVWNATIVTETKNLRSKRFVSKYSISFSMLR